ncbi:Acyl carrier protein-like protein [Cynara cardunculus var. scolymus]|uniref:Acyl carrier protein n=1 Tax=Cynara cardunculus var. scolymus TaxID=59895 RepID=A0A103YLZ5_CYNCS|nr:Acyl carrier protein-like protein [Cynara cardunculus var. scolymus]
MRHGSSHSHTVTESTDFQKDLSLDSLDRVELVMAFAQEFSIEIPDEQADKLKCCADVANYIKFNVKGSSSSSSRTTGFAAVFLNLEKEFFIIIRSLLFLTDSYRYRTIMLYQNIILNAINQVLTSICYNEYTMMKFVYRILLPRIDFFQ